MRPQNQAKPLHLSKLATAAPTAAQHPPCRTGLRCRERWPAGREDNRARREAVLRGRTVATAHGCAAAVLVEPHRRMGGATAA